MFNIYNKHIL